MVRAPFLAPLLLAAMPAQAQRLPYEDALAPEPPPRLDYATQPGGEESVRAFYGDRLEWRPQRGADVWNWDWSAEVGGARHRLWLATTGDGTFGEGFDYFEVQALYSRPLGESGLSLQAGLRQDFVPRPRRSYAVAGVQGNVTDPLYVGAFGFLSRQGEFTARLFTYYDLQLPGPLILQPAAEAEIAASDVPELGIGAGPVYLEAGLRLRYRVAEAFAPYVGVNWERLLGRTATLARDAGEEVESTSFVLGVRSYF